MNAVDGASAPSGVASLPASIPLKRDPATDASAPVGDAAWLVFAAVMLLLVPAIIIARRRALKAKGPWWRHLRAVLDTTQPAEIQRVSSTRLSPRHSLHVVVWNGRRLLVGCTDQSMQLLAEAPVGTVTVPPESA